MSAPVPPSREEAALLPASAYTYGPQLARQLQLETLLTDGRGNFAVSSLSGVPTRRSSGLVVHGESWKGHNHLVSPLEGLNVAGEEIALHTLEIAPQVFEGRGLDVLSGATVWDLLPDREQLWRGTRVQRQSFMPQGHGALVLLYEVESRQSVTLTLGGFFVDRELDTLHRSAPNLMFGHTGKQVTVQGEGKTRVSLHFMGDHGHQTGLPEPIMTPLTPSPFSQRVYYRTDAVKGEPNTEYVRGCALWRVTFPPGGGQVAVVFQGLSADSQPVGDPWQAHQLEMQRRRGLAEHAWHASGVFDELIATLAVAADAYLVQTSEGPGIITGYPNGTLGGREALLSLTGLALVTGRAEDAKAILANCTTQTLYGLMPNGRAENGQLLYNSVDSGLWFIVALERYARITADGQFIRDCLPTVRDILGWYVQGTEHSIQVDAYDGLLGAGDPGAPITWMNAIVRDLDVTPRQGKAVEVQALWLAALGAEVRMSEALGEEPSFAKEHLTAREGFLKFWQEERPEQHSEVTSVLADLLGLGAGGLSGILDQGSAMKLKSAVGSSGLESRAQASLRSSAVLVDLISPEGELDRSIRPNAVIAAALADTPATEAQVDAVIQQTELHLLTPVGLHSLTPMDKRYQGTLTNPKAVADDALHQGSVWPWPLGSYVELLLSRQELLRARAALSGLIGHVWEVGIGHISEVFSGDGLNPSGNPFQAAGLAELLRTHVLTALSETRQEELAAASR